MFNIANIELGSRRGRRHTKNKRPSDSKQRFKQLRSREPLLYDQRSGFFVKMALTIHTNAEKLEDMRADLLND